MVRLGEELEQSAQTEAREKENARYYQQRLQDMRLELEDLIQREQESSRKRMELVHLPLVSISRTGPHHKWNKCKNCAVHCLYIP